MRELRTGDTVAINDSENSLSEIGLYNGSLHEITSIREIRWIAQQVRYAKLHDCENPVLCDKLVFVQSKDHFEVELFEL